MIFFKLIIFLTSVIITNQARASHAILISPPKAGTWMLERTVGHITKKQNVAWKMLYYDMQSSSIKAQAYREMSLFTPPLDLFDACTNLVADDYMLSHLVWDKAYEDILSKKQFKVILIIRDPRDQLVSRTFYMLKHTNLFPGIAHLSFDQLLLGLIGADTQPEQLFPDLLNSHLSYQQKPLSKAISHIKKFYEPFLPWQKSVLCYTTTFEKLVGKRGGGSDELQRKEIENIAAHLGIMLDVPEIDSVAQAIFGRTDTFREGQIGSWKKHFTDEHKQAFKKVASDLLIALGYEVDNNW